MAVPKSVDGGDDAAAIGSVEAGAGFVLFLMGFDEACAGGEDCREGEKEAADDGAESLRDQSCDNADCSAECEADDPLVGFNSLDCGETSMDDHGGYLTISQNANETANQTGMRVMVAVRARGFQRMSMQHTRGRKAGMRSRRRSWIAPRRLRRFCRDWRW